MKSFLFIGLVVLGCAVASGQAGDRLISPTRGFQPAHSYALSDIESIDKGTGSLSLHIPITQLPPSPAGLTAGVTLSYSLGGHLKTGHKWTVQNRPTEWESGQEYLYPDGADFGKHFL